MEGGGSLWLLTFLVGLSLVTHEMTMVGGADLSPSQCKEEIRLGTNACVRVEIMAGKPASPECCQRVRVSHVECICPVVSAQIASIFPVDKAIKLLQGCGRQVPRHFKCGSYNFP
ncbi:hypothetical protein Tsubulata_019127 [Turnera subulata]|uniref:Bifunctional inhibitor/plant lipid transfer protein/seed storage helical domain-containing protein n=1 Tax=Turnera subulata TaxID=218843 RepID=A0A9Q0GHU3_9ROSI|nr:hypothetical protein Tsubulata_019127 [Turnera subulata]